jgi:hypothetical protein
MKLEARIMLAGLLALCLASCQLKTGSNADMSRAESSAPPVPAKGTKLPTYEGPFGLQMGLTRDQVRVLIPDLEYANDAPGFAWSSNAPKPHPDFESYGFQFSEKSGLCNIIAIGKDISSGDTGHEVRSAFDNIEEALTSKYGKGKLFDFSSERFSSPEFWMMHLSQKNRTLAKAWASKYGSTLTHNIGLIGLKANASDVSTGHLSLYYEFSNSSDCKAESKADNHKPL